MGWRTYGTRPMPPQPPSHHLPLQWEEQPLTDTRGHSGDPQGLTPWTGSGFSFILWVEDGRFALRKKERSAELQPIPSDAWVKVGSEVTQPPPSLCLAAVFCLCTPRSPAPVLVPSPLDPAQVGCTQSICQHRAPCSPSHMGMDSDSPSPPHISLEPTTSSANPWEEAKFPLFLHPIPTKHTCGRRSRGGAGAAARSQWWPSPRPPWLPTPLPALEPWSPWQGGRPGGETSPSQATGGGLE